MNRSTARARLERLRARGLIEKDAEGRWRIAGDGVRPTQPFGDKLTNAEPGAERGDLGPAPAYALWVRSLSCYERRTTSEIHGTRYG
jgi:hypothetical protein